MRLSTREENPMGSAGRYIRLFLLAMSLLAVPPVIGGAGSATAQSLAEYRLGPGDKLKLTVFGHADLSGEFEINSEGQVTVPLLGQVRAASATVAELQETIAAGLDRSFIVDPRVSIDVINYRPFFILGQVNRPGQYPYVSGLDIRQAVAIAGGYTRRARTSTVRVIRGPTTERQNFEAPPDTLVLPGDTIEVTRRLF